MRNGKRSRNATEKPRGRPAGGMAVDGRKRWRRLPEPWTGGGVLTFAALLLGIFLVATIGEPFAAGKVGRAEAVQHLVGVAIALLVLGMTAGSCVARYRPDLVLDRTQRAGFALFTLALVATTRVFFLAGVSPLTAPVALMIMVICLVYGRQFGLQTAVFYGLLVGITQGMSGQHFVVLTIGAMVAALLSDRVRTRSTLVKAGLVVGVTQALAAVGFGLLIGAHRPLITLRFWESPLSSEALFALANGVLSGFLVSGLLPAIEWAFGVTTDIRLLEWSDPNQPLLQRLLLEAPGTYHHSMLIGSLAADAAEAVGANPLLARVGAYFHDVGKLKKPEYFGENLAEGERNPHEDLTPTMSSLVITSHPRDGADMAERYGLPHGVHDIILQSHGSTMIKYFWDRAKDQSDEDDVPQESTFRYRLPKPASKEAACVMLSDAVESSCRALGKPSPPQVSGVIHSIVMDRLHDGQLDESGLTITDLARIEESLARSMNAVFHNRVRYPDQPTGEENAKEEVERAPDDGSTDEAAADTDSESTEQTDV